MTRMHVHRHSESVRPRATQASTGPDARRHVACVAVPSQPDCRPGRCGKHTCYPMAAQRLCNKLSLEVRSAAIRAQLRAPNTHIFDSTIRSLSVWLHPCCSRPVAYLVLHPKLTPGSGDTSPSVHTPPNAKIHTHVQIHIYVHTPPNAKIIIIIKKGKHMKPTHRLPTRR